MKALKQKFKDILAQAKGTRWDRVAARVCGWGAILVALSPYVHLLPAPEARIIAGLLGFVGQYLPRAQKAAGLLSLAYGQQTPLLKVLPQLAATLLAAPQITAEAKAQEQAQAEEEKQKAVSTQIDQAVEKKFASLTPEDLKNLTGEFARADLAREASGVAEEKTTDVAEAAGETEAAPGAAVGAETALPTLAPAQASTPAEDAGLTTDSIQLTGGNQ